MLGCGCVRLRRQRRSADRTPKTIPMMRGTWLGICRRAATPIACRAQGDHWDHLCASRSKLAKVPSLIRCYHRPAICKRWWWISRDDRCPLGQWLHGAGGQRWGGQPGFIALLGKHAEFHDVAGSVARQINSGAMAEAEQLLGSGSRFAQVSTAVSTLLTRAKRGL